MANKKFDLVNFFKNIQNCVDEVATLFENAEALYSVPFPKNEFNKHVKTLRTEKEYASFRDIVFQDDTPFATFDSKEDADSFSNSLKRKPPIVENQLNKVKLPTVDVLFTNLKDVDVEKLSKVLEVPIYSFDQRNDGKTLVKFLSLPVYLLFFPSNGIIVNKDDDSNNFRMVTWDWNNHVNCANCSGPGHTQSQCTLSPQQVVAYHKQRDLRNVNHRSYNSTKSTGKGPSYGLDSSRSRKNKRKKPNKQDSKSPTQDRGKEAEGSSSTKEQHGKEAEVFSSTVEDTPLHSPVFEPPEPQTNVETDSLQQTEHNDKNATSAVKVRTPSPTASLKLPSSKVKKAVSSSFLSKRSTQPTLSSSSNRLDLKSPKKSNQEEYDIESILDYKVVNGTEKWLVKWRGFARTEATWEPLSNFSEGGKELITAYHKKFRKPRKK
jgi:hypothetical protein